MEDKFEYTKVVIRICISKGKAIQWPKENGENEKN
jgi:hypothetical protein